ncbi:hypothetical protein CLIB1423_09S01398 [[Candida] railenensis]|uniref:Amino acid transporter transmembrane domain-containing protein n=1 Tax=[Candida] railenensis TaxID=45579 RepID=A0A9P0QPF9_9ASCO|nr:hypothetical protein CLIB1423_09S01398 [[Candida] railenensis]
MSDLKVIKSVASAVVSENGRVLEKLANEDQQDFYHISLEEILYEAKLQRELEKSEEWGEPAPTLPMLNLVKGKLFAKKPQSSSSNSYSSDAVVDEKQTGFEGDDDLVSEPINKSLENANRMVRTASWGSVFYLITTDILGPTSAPYSVSQLGYVPGCLLYLLFGIAAAYTGFLLWGQFLTLDSRKYPLHSFGDVVGRIYGKYTRYGVDCLQTLQLICNVAVITLGNGQGLSQMAKGKGCYTALILVWAIIGMIVGQIKSLQRFGFLANLAIWMNVFVIIATMACVSKQLPNYTAAAGTAGVVKGPVVTHVIVSGAGSEAFQSQLTACMNIVYAYGGAMVFIEFMSEMKRPRDFIKGMACAQLFIFTVYLLYGMIVYHYQGQFVINPANQGISHYGWQTACNVVNLLSAIIAAGLYGNVGIKVFYTSFIQKVFNAPSLNSKKGRFIWTFLVIVYWAVAFVIASAIPQFSYLTGLVGAICILQFTYTFPPIMQFGLDFQIAAMQGDGPYDPVNKVANRVDSWSNLSRWVRAYKVNWFKNTCHIIFFLAALATACLGMYSSGEGFAHSFADGVTTSFTCNSPVA